MTPLAPSPGLRHVSFPSSAAQRLNASSVTSNVFGAVFARLGTATLMTNTLLALPFSPTVIWYDRQ